MKSIREELCKKSETVLTELNECFKVVSTSLVPSERGVYITDNKVQCRMTVVSYLPKDVTCTRAAISIERCTEDRTDRRTPVKSYKTDLSVSSSVASPRRGPAEADNETTNLITR